MTISSVIRRAGPFNGNGSTTVFAREFVVLDADHLKVYQTIAGVTTEVTSGISKDGIGTAAGNVTFSTAPATGTQITLLREIPLVQETDYSNQGKVEPERVEDDFDLQEMKMQELSETLSRALRLPITSALTGLEIPDPASGKTIVGKADGTGWEDGPTTAQIIAAADLAAAAAASLASFEQIYLGMKSSPPTVDNVGNALTTGAQYFDSVTNKPFIWTAADEWSPAVFDTAGALLAANNLSDLAAAGTARTSLGLGTAAVTDADAYATAAQGTKADDAAPLESPALTGNPTAPTQAAGNDSTRLATTAFVQAETATVGVGVGQTWQDVRVSRPLNTTFQNTTGKPIVVFIAPNAGSSTNYFSVSDDNVTWVLLVDLNNAARGGPTSVVIPNNHYYKTGSTEPITYWAELR